MLDVAISGEAFALPKHVEASGATATCNRNSTSRITLVELGHVKIAAWRSRLWKGYMREAGIGFLMLNSLGRSIFFSIGFDMYSNTQCST